MDELIDSRLSIFSAGTSNRSPNSAFSPFGLGLQETLAYRKRFRGLIGVCSKIPLNGPTGLRLLYTPGSAPPCPEVGTEPLSSLDSPIRGKTMPLFSDGPADFGFRHLG